jgi:hypothetical protein
MRFKTIVFALLLLPILMQASFKKEAKFTSTQYVGLLVGDAGFSISANTMAGIHYKRFDYHIGAAFNYMDDYVMFPIYANSRFYLTKKQNSFVCADIGMNHTTEFEANEDRFKPGNDLYSSLGIGIKKKWAGDVYYITQISYNNSKAALQRNRAWQGPPVWEKININYQFIEVKFGINF